MIEKITTTGKSTEKFLHIITLAMVENVGSKLFVCITNDVDTKLKQY